MFKTFRCFSQSKIYLFKNPGAFVCPKKKKEHFFLTLSKTCISLPVSSLKKFLLPRKIPKDCFYYSISSINSTGVGVYCFKNSFLTFKYNPSTSFSY